MPNVDDHGLEVLKKAARNIGDTPKTDYGLQTYSTNFVTSAMSFDQKMILEGRSFTHNQLNTLSNGANLDFTILAPNTDRETHFKYSSNSSASCILRIYEAPVLTTGGLLTPYNRNRNSSITNGSILNSVTAVTTLGTLIRETQFGQGTGGGIAGQFESALEIIFKKNTRYLIRLTSQSNNNIISSILNWLEYDPINDMVTK